MSTEYGFVIVIVFIIIVVAVFRKFASTDTFDERVKYLKRYRSMDDDDLEEVLARLLRDKLADGDSLSAIRHVMSERSLCNTPAEKDKSWQEPLVTENNKHHTQAKEEKASQPKMDDDTPEGGSEINVVTIKVTDKQKRLLQNLAVYGFLAFHGIKALYGYQLSQDIEEEVIAHYAEHYPRTKIQIIGSSTYQVHGDIYDSFVDLKIDGEVRQVTVRVWQNYNYFFPSYHFRVGG